MLSNHFLANQIAGKSVRISCHIIMCWIELTVQFWETSTGRVEWPSRWSIGCYVCASRFKAYYRQNQGSIYFGVWKLPSKDLSFLPHWKKLAKMLKMVSFLWKEYFFRLKTVFPSEKGMVQKNICQLHVHPGYVFSSSSSTIPCPFSTRWKFIPFVWHQY